MTSNGQASRRARAQRSATSRATPTDTGPRGADADFAEKDLPQGFSPAVLLGVLLGNGTPTRLAQRLTLALVPLGCGVGTAGLRGTWRAASFLGPPLAVVLGSHVHHSITFHDTNALLPVALCT